MMKVIHDTRSVSCRSPYGAVAAGTVVDLKVIIEDGDLRDCRCRLWVDGKGEKILPMDRSDEKGRTLFSCRIETKEPELIWYHFILSLPEGGELRCGAREGRVGGEGQLYDREPPSFQLTVYRPRPLPEWYREAVVYQIFPDRFRRGEDWQELTKNALQKERGGPSRVLCEDWYKVPYYEKDAKGRVVSWEFYGGTLSGIREKLPYLKRLGVTALYLNPIFEAASNHRYDTGDYLTVDAMLGGNEAFRELAEAAEEMGISLILDGVFNHSGCDSIYFNKYGNYDSMGAFQSGSSPYREWYRFDDSPAGYSCWWGVDDLPAFEESAEGFQKLLLEEPDGVVSRWLRAGAKGWRLDVADELSDDLIRKIKKTVTDTRGEEGLLLGEVWEDASNKISYGNLRRYLLGDELDSVMNYPLRDAVHRFLLGRIPAEDLYETLESLRENYPPEALYGALNLMGSHDRARILTLMGEAPDPSGMTDEEKRDYRLSPEQKNLAKGRIWLMTLLQLTLPGVPCIYYGDEAGLEGYADPFNRSAYPWGREDPDLMAIYRNAVDLRKTFPVFTSGSFRPFCQGTEVFGFVRGSEEDSITVMINRSRFESQRVVFPAGKGVGTDLVGGLPVKRTENGNAEIELPPLGSAAVLFKGESMRLAAPAEKGCGVLCHITSLPCETGPGNIGTPSLEFVEFLARSGQKYWQILPLNPTDEYGSPYAGASAFAANPFLMPESEEELRQGFASFREDEEYRRFYDTNSHWLKPYSLFTALKKKHGQKDWQEWPEEDRRYDPDREWEEDIRQESAFQAWCQYRFQQEWEHLHRYALERGIRIIGDLPMYVSADSADAWARPDLFTLGEDDRPSRVAGVPPDYFAEEGQVWGNPLYDWDKLRKEEYDWWIRRLERVFDLYDYVRLDHFRGFSSYWSVPAGEKATTGRWEPGPGAKLFQNAAARLGPLPVIAEDLGSLTPAVRGLVERCGFPGIDVIQFYDGDPLQEYTPPPGKIAYSGTHDNQTLRGWCEGRYPQREPAETADRVLKNLMNCPAKVVILPLQDAAGLSDEARMNVPGVAGGNWQWQAKPSDLKEAARKLSELKEERNRSETHG